MAQPTVTLVPQRPVVSADSATVLDVLIKVEVPPGQQQTERPFLNLGLVIDRSGSMQGDKLAFAKQAAAHLVQQLKAHDRISLTVFDDEVQTLIPSVLADNPQGVQAAITQIHAGGSTDLHGGWLRGAEQVQQFLDPQRLNRVILLSDGQANVGETNPDAIASRVHKLHGKGLSTSAMGIGDDYNEELLEAMVRSGDGNYYFIQDPEELPAVFQVELLGLAALVGQRVSLGIRGVNGVEVLDVLNDFDRTTAGNHKLPNLIHGGTVAVVVRMRAPAIADETDLCSIRLAFDVTDQADRQTIMATLRLGSVLSGKLDDFPRDEEVQQHVALLMAARARKEAMRQLNSGDRAGAQQTLYEAMGAVSSAPSNAVMMAEMSMLSDLDHDLQAGADELLRKKASFQAYSRRCGKDQTRYGVTRRSPCSPQIRCNSPRSSQLCEAPSFPSWQPSRWYWARPDSPAATPYPASPLCLASPRSFPLPASMATGWWCVPGFRPSAFRSTRRTGRSPARQAPNRTPIH